MLMQFESPLLDDFILALFDLRVIKLLYPAALQANQMVVMMPFIQFKRGLARFEMMALQQTRLLKLGQHAIHRGQTNIHVVSQQVAIYILGSNMPCGSFLRQFVKQVKNFQARHSGLEATVFKVIRMRHVENQAQKRGNGKAGTGIYDIVFRLRWTPQSEKCQARPGHLCAIASPQTPDFPMKRFFSILPFLALCLALCSACSGVNQVTSYIKPYRIDVRQGNWVDQEMVSQLKPGQTRDQVRFILGSPLVSDMFHADRWDYIYRFQPGRGEAEQRRLIVYFQDEKLVRVGGDVVADDGRRVESKPVNQVIDVAGPNTAKQEKPKTE